MEREFIELAIFTSQWKSLGLSEEDLKNLEEFLCMSPESGNVIKGTGGVRKLRWSLHKRGKRGSVRILYIDFPEIEKSYLLTVYAKNQKETITKQEKQVIGKLISELKRLNEEIKK